MTITRSDKIKCLRREIALRRNNYPKWVEQRRMSQEMADHELSVMQAIHDDYMEKEAE